MASASPIHAGSSVMPKKSSAALRDLLRTQDSASSAPSSASFSMASLSETEKSKRRSGKAAPPPVLPSSGLPENRCVFVQKYARRRVQNIIVWRYNFLKSYQFHEFLATLSGSDETVS